MEGHTIFADPILVPRRSGQSLSRRRALKLSLTTSLGLGLGVASLGANAFAREVRNGVVIERRYVDCRYGQLHVHIAKPVNPSLQKHNPILCFHPSPASGWYFRDYIADMGRDRIAIAADTPGFGESDRPPTMPESMAEFSGAMADALESLGYGGSESASKVDLLGYLTGCVIALDLAVQRPDLVRKVCLVSPPYIDDDAIRAQRIRDLTYGPYTEDGKRVMATWDGAVKRRVEGVTLEQAIHLFQERLRSGDKDWWAYKAVYTYQYDENFSALTQPLALINPLDTHDESIAKAMRDAPNATEIGPLNIGRSPFSLRPDLLAEESRKFLDSSV